MADALSVMCKIEMPSSENDDVVREMRLRRLPRRECSRPSFALSLQYGGTRTVNSAYTFNAGQQIGEGTYGQVFMGHEKGGNQVSLPLIRVLTRASAAAYIGS